MQTKSTELHPVLATNAETALALLNGKPKNEAIYNPDFTTTELTIISFLEEWYPKEFAEAIHQIPNKYFWYGMEPDEIMENLILLTNELHAKVVDGGVYSALGKQENQRVKYWDCVKYWDDIYLKVFRLIGYQGLM